MSAPREVPKPTRRKVVHLITRLDPGGSTEEALESSAGLAAEGWDVILASGPGLGGTGAVPDGGAARIELVSSLTRDPHPIADPIALWQIIRLLRRERPDIVHTHSAKAGVLGRWGGFLCRVPIIVHTPHGHVLYGYARGLKNWIYLFAERVTARITHCLVAVSAGERRESVAAGIGRDSQWVVVHSGVHFEKLPRRDASVSTTCVRIGVVARLEHVKGVDLLIRAAAALRASEPATPYSILVWGSGDLEVDLKRLCRDLGVTDAIEFVGTSQDVHDFMRGLDVYTQPSRNEGMGRALVVAQAMGVPIVATSVCGIPDVVRHGETGLLAPAEDPDALARALRHLIEEGDTRRAMGEAAQRWMAHVDQSGHPVFSYAAMLWHLRRTYERLLGGET